MLRRSISAFTAAVNLCQNLRLDDTLIRSGFFPPGLVDSDDNTHNILFVTVIAAVVIGGMQPARADWINRTGAETAPNIAEIYVLDDRVRVKLEVYIGDLD